MGAYMHAWGGLWAVGRPDLPAGGSQSESQPEEKVAEGWNSQP